MALILRVDVDKPYGSSTFFQKVISKLREDYWFPVIHRLPYLHAVETFLEFCNSRNVSGILHFRNCTIPSSNVMRLLGEGSHVLGFHAENTRTFATFSEELKSFRTQVKTSAVPIFSKHGSGYHKLGKNHHAAYEPDKYIEWAAKCSIKYPFGNGIASSPTDFESQDGFYPKMFWIEREHQSPNFKTLEEVVEIAKHRTVPILIHPENFCSTKVVRKDFEMLIDLAKSAQVNWELPIL